MSARGSRGNPVTQSEYDKKARELKERKAEIAARIEQHQQGDNDFRTTVEGLISVASRASELFARSNLSKSGNSLLSCFRTCG